ncbi:MAG: alpha/beta hydrolase fold domain-containing protein [Erysipelotrichaceae bacterium]|nr:alpha/beta hydrolase fold domain-containing protein [Erysipelotrichaceae bacterium]
MKVIQASSKQMQDTAKIVGNATGGFVFKDGLEKVNWKLVRLMCNIGYSFMKKEKGVKVTSLDLNGIHGELTSPDNRINDNIIMYLHGGGFVSGSAKATRAYCSVLARFSGYDVISIDYRLSPENTYPAAIEDCVKAFLAVHEQFPKAKIALTGESAGGYLCLATAITLIDMNEYLPACMLPQSPLCCIYGGLDRSYYEIKDNTVEPEAVDNGGIGKLFAPNGDKGDHRLDMRTFECFDKMPPALISFDANETLRADAETICELYRKNGADCDLIMIKDSFHACSTSSVGTPETFELMLDDIEFLRRHFNDSYYERREDENICTADRAGVDHQK